MAIKTNVRALLNVRSHYSLLESVVNVDQYLSMAVTHKLPWLSLVDHGSMFFHFAFYHKCEKFGIKPVLGISFTLLFGQHSLESALIAGNFAGMQQLMQLSSAFFSVEPANLTVTWNNLQPYLVGNHNHLVLCPTAAQRAVWTKVKPQLRRQTWYLGVNDRNQTQIQAFSVHPDKHLWFKPVQYLMPAHRTTYHILKAIKDQIPRQELKPDRTTFDLISDPIPAYLNVNAERLVKKTNVRWDYASHHQVFASYPTPASQTTTQCLRTLAHQGLAQKLAVAQLDQTYQQRLDYELTVIEQTKFANYFLVVYDYVRFAREQHILVGPGRGSAAGSLVSYALNITDIDPIKFKLIFERFLNRARRGMPDIDVDVQDNKRDAVITYLVRKYGADRVSYINTFQRLKLKMALRDVGRVYQVPLPEINELAKLIGSRTYAEFKSSAQNPNHVESVYWHKYHFIFQHLPLLIGLPRQTGTHAAGVIITQQPLVNIVPTMLGLNGVLKTQWDMEHFERLGLIKMDILGLTNLTVIANTLDNINAQQQRLVLNRIPLCDPATFKLLAAGDTAGIFQLESKGMTKLLTEMQPRQLEDIAITSALFRPGPAVRKDQYLRRRQQQHYVFADPDCPALNAILQPTLGVMIFQEQVMLIAQQIAGFSLTQAELLRQAMAKKDAASMAKLKASFWTGARAHARPERVITKFWTLIARFSGYGFNRAHALAYALIGYWMAYLKANFWMFFFTALLNSVIGEEVKTHDYLKLVIQRQQILPPAINHPVLHYVYQQRALQLPLILIKQVGSLFGRQIHADVAQHGAYQDVFDLCRRLRPHGLNQQTYLGLVYSGALDQFNVERGALAANYELILNYAELTQRAAAQHQTTTTLPAPPQLTGTPLTPEQRSRLEFKYLGFYLTQHPVATIRRRVAPAAVSIKQLLGTTADHATIVGWINRQKVIKDKNRQDMAFVEVEDESGSIDLTAFASNYSRLRLQLTVGQVVKVKIKRGQFYRGRSSFIILELHPVDQHDKT